MSWFADLQEFIHLFYLPAIFFLAAFGLVAGVLLAVLDLIRRNIRL